MALQGLPGAQAYMSATAIASATTLTDDEMAHALRDSAGISPPGTRPGSDGMLPPLCRL